MTDATAAPSPASSRAEASHTETVLIIDFGSQVTQLIARRVREAGVYSEIVPFNAAEGAMERLKPRAVILSGGPASVTEMGTLDLWMQHTRSHHRWKLEFAVRTA